MNELVTGLLTSLVSSVVAFAAGRLWGARRRVINYLRRRGVALIVGSRGDVTVVYGGRGVAGSEANMIRSGDMDALVRLSSTVERYRGRGIARIRIASPTTTPATGSEILIGGPNANPRSRTILRTTDHPTTAGTPFVQVTVSGTSYSFKIGADTYRLRHTAGAISQDYGVILSIPHPAHSGQRVTLVCGLKGYGTRAAADFIDTARFRSASKGFNRNTSFCVVVGVAVDADIAAAGTLVKVYG